MALNKKSSSTLCRWRHDGRLGSWLRGEVPRVVVVVFTWCCVCVCVCVLIDVLLLMLEKERVMKAGVEAMSTAYGTQYPYGPGSEVLCEYFHNTTAISDGHPLTKPTRPHCVRFDVGNNQRLRVRSAGHRARIHARTAQLRSGLRAAGQRHHPRGHRSLERSQGHGKRINSVIMIFHFLAWRGGLSKN